MTWRPIADELATALRRQGQCLCHSRALWPWRRDETCDMHKALAAYEMATARTEIVQTPSTAAGVALRQVADLAGERTDE